MLNGRNGGSAADDAQSDEDLCHRWPTPDQRSFARAARTSKPDWRPQWKPKRRLPPPVHLGSRRERPGRQVPAAAGREPEAERPPLPPAPPTGTGGADAGWGGEGRADRGARALPHLFLRRAPASTSCRAARGASAGESGGEGGAGSSPGEPGQRPGREGKGRGERKKKPRSLLLLPPPGPPRPCETRATAAAARWEGRGGEGKGKPSAGCRGREQEPGPEPGQPRAGTHAQLEGRRPQARPWGGVGEVPPLSRAPFGASPIPQFAAQGRVSVSGSCRLPLWQLRPGLTAPGWTAGPGAGCRRRPQARLGKAWGAPPARQLCPSVLPLIVR